MTMSRYIKMTKQIFVIGYYGSGNMGDELLLRETINLFKKHVSINNISALSYNVENTWKNHRIKGISRNKFFRILKGITNSDLVVGGGGSMLQNVTSNRSLLYYLALINISLLLNKEVILIGNGIGPINGWWQKKMVKWTLLRTKLVHLRDAYSYEWLNNPVSHEHVMLGADLALKYHGMRDNTNKSIIINLRIWDGVEQTTSAMGGFIEYLKQKKHKVELVSMQSGHDEKAMEALGKVQTFNELDALEKVFSKGRFVIGMRLHSLIVGASYGMPFLGLSYDPKVKAFCEIMGQPYFDEIEEITTERLIKAFEQLVEQEKSSQEMIKKNMLGIEIEKHRMMVKINELFQK